MNLRRVALALLLGLVSCSVLAGERLLVATAANFKPAMERLIAGFETHNTGADLEASYGSTGKLAAQVREGAPFDLFFSADVDAAQALVISGHALAPAKVYARGRLALWSTTVDASKLALADLVRPEFAKIAIANPRTAPYGARAVEALKAAKVWDAVESRLVYGENIAQTAQFVHSGNAQIGLIALSQALEPELSQRGGHALVPEALHAPLDQAFVITARAKGNALAAQFADYVASDDGRRVIEAHGYTLPRE